MQQLTLSEPFRRGLRPKSNTLYNMPYLSECQGMRPSAGGLEPLATLATVPVSSETWPFPALIPQSRIWLGRSAIRSVSSSLTLSSALSPISLQSALNAGTSSFTLPTSTTDIPWRSAEVGRCWVAVRDDATLLGLPWLSASPLGTTSLLADSVCELGGRFLFAGLDNASWTSGTTFAEYWQTAKDASTFPVVPNAAFGSNVLYYSTPYGLDQEEPFAVDLAVWGLYTTGTESAKNARLAALDALRSGTCGFVILPTSSACLGVVAIGTTAFAFCADAVFYLDFSQGKPQPVQIAQFGLGGGYCATPSGVYFQDGRDQLWQITTTGKALAAKLDFSEYLTTLTGPVVWLWEPEEQELYISGSNKTYILTQAGLCQAHTAYSGFLSADVGPAGAGFAHSTSGVTVQTHLMDLGSSNSKRLLAADLSGWIASAYLGWEYRMDRTQAMRAYGGSLAWSGVVKSNLVATDFSLRLTGLTAADNHIDSVNITFDWADGRYPQLQPKGQ